MKVMVPKRAFQVRGTQAVVERVAVSAVLGIATRPGRADT
jgi:hypothetical protein